MAGAEQGMGRGGDVFQEGTVGPQGGLVSYRMELGFYSGVIGWLSKE